MAGSSRPSGPAWAWSRTGTTWRSTESPSDPPGTARGGAIRSGLPIARPTAPPPSEAPPMHVLLTGGYGCIGSWIARNLLRRGDRVWVYDLKEDSRRLRLILPEEQVRQVRFVCGDVTELHCLKNALSEHGITHVVHL